MSLSEIILIRHGETEWNKTRRLQGNLDIPLNDTGREQVREAAKHIRSLIAETPGTLPLLENSVGADYIYSSPLARAAESAKIIANEIGFPEDCIIYDEGVQEWNGGEIQGILLPELEEKCPAAWHAWRVERNPHYEFNGGESFAQRRERVVGSIQALADRHPNQRIIVVSHSGVIDEVFRRAKNVPMQNFTRIPKLNAGIYILQISNSPPPTQDESKLAKPKWKILRWGCQKVSDRKASIEFNLGVKDGEFDPFSTEYA